MFTKILFTYIIPFVPLTNLVTQAEQGHIALFYKWGIRNSERPRDLLRASPSLRGRVHTVCSSCESCTCTVLSLLFPPLLHCTLNFWYISALATGLLARTHHQLRRNWARPSWSCSLFSGSTSQTIWLFWPSTKQMQWFAGCHQSLPPFESPVTFCSSQLP